LAVVKSPKNKKNKQDWVKSLKRKNQNMTPNPLQTSPKKFMYSSKNLNSYFLINWKLNNW